MSEMLSELIGKLHYFWILKQTYENMETECLAVSQEGIHIITELNFGHSIGPCSLSGDQK